MRSADLAYLAGLIDQDPGRYHRKAQVQEELQRAWRAASTAKTKRIKISISTMHAENGGEPEKPEAGDES